RVVQGYKWMIAFTIFFFQAEDGIRDFHVTGVQTCALPIYVSEMYFLDLRHDVLLPMHPSSTGIRYVHSASATCPRQYRYRRVPTKQTSSGKRFSISLVHS